MSAYLGLLHLDLKPACRVEILRKGADASDPNTGGATPDDYQNMESIQQQTQDQQDTYGSAGSQQDAVEQGEDTDVEDGH